MAIWVTIVGGGPFTLSPCTRALAAKTHMSVIASWSIPTVRSVEVHTDGCIGAFWVHWVRSSSWSFLRWGPGFCVRTVCLQVVHWVTICAPAVPYEGLVVERPRMNPVVDQWPISFCIVGCLRPEAVVVNYPGWPAEPLAEVGDVFLIQEKGSGPLRVFWDKYCRVYWKTLQPCWQIWYESFSWSDYIQAVAV